MYGLIGNELSSNVGRKLKSLEMLDFIRKKMIKLKFIMFNYEWLRAGNCSIQISAAVSHSANIHNVNYRGINQVIDDKIKKL